MRKGYYKICYNNHGELVYYQNLDIPWDFAVGLCKHGVKIAYRIWTRPK